MLKQHLFRHLLVLLMAVAAVGLSHAQQDAESVGQPDMEPGQQQEVTQQQEVVEQQEPTIEQQEPTEQQASAEQEQPVKSLNRQVQDLKQQVIELNRDLFILEEELLFPANTQIAVFLSMDVGEFFQLDAVKLTLDEKVVTNYLYTDKQIDALHRGGVQRLYMGNLKTGEHELVAVFTGRGPKGRDYRRGATVIIDKTSQAKKIELKIVDSTATQQPEFLVKEW